MIIMFLDLFQSSGLFRSHQTGQTGDSFFNSLRLGVGEVQAQRVSARAAEVKFLAGDKSDILLQSQGEERAGVGRWGQRGQEKHAPVGTSPRDLPGEMSFERGQQGVATVAILGPEHGQELVEETTANQFEDDVLGEGPGMQVRSLLGHHEFIDDLRGCERPANAQAGHQNFGEGAHVNDQTVKIARRVGRGIEFQ